MAWNYRKRVKICPGVTLNLSKKGISTTIGPKGANVNIGKRGTYLNTGIPGTGLYKRTRLDGEYKSTYSDTENTVASPLTMGMGCILIASPIIILFLLIYTVVMGSIFGFIMTLLMIVVAIILYYHLENISKKESLSENTNVSITTASYDKYDNISSFISEELFWDILTQVTAFLEFSEKLNDNPDFHEYTNELDNIKIKLSNDNKFGRLGANTFLGKIQIIMLIDLTRAFLNAGHKLNLGTKEGFGLLLFVSELYGSEIRYNNLELYRDNLIEPTQSLLNQLLAVPEPEERFILSKLINDFNDDIKRRYHVLIYRYISLIAKIDSTVTEQEKKSLEEIMSLTKTPAITSKEEKFPEQTDIRPQDELNSLIGLKKVKGEITKLTNLIIIQQQRKKKGLKVTNPSHHCVFTGNPGTGKTTVARIVARIYKELGVVKKGHLIETDRSGLVAEYVGQTAVKTNKIIDKALDGVLFIDEAYSLVGKGNNDYGNEAIATLLKRMEDDRDRLIVILAGYSDEMQGFINSNPGLQSRFNKYIDFTDYTAGELLDIFKLYANKFEYQITPEALNVLSTLFTKAVDEKKRGFGNGRYVRNIFDKTIELQSTRLSGEGKLSVSTLMEILPEDIPDV